MGINVNLLHVLIQKCHPVCKGVSSVRKKCQEKSTVFVEARSLTFLDMPGLGFLFMFILTWNSEKQTCIFFLKDTDHFDSITNFTKSYFLWLMKNDCSLYNM